jgi:predicted AlkP superfamily pyrophosphatase or phosphodiesterase
MLEPNPGRMQEVEAALTAMPHVTLLPEAERADQYNFAGHRRIPSVVALADEGWTVARTRAFVEDRPEYPSGGSHGYEPSLPSMRALFVARGPAFAEGKAIAPFPNVDIYPLLCDLLDLDPAPNDGTLEDLGAARR